MKYTLFTLMMILFLAACDKEEDSEAKAIGPRSNDKKEARTINPEYSYYVGAETGYATLTSPSGKDIMRYEPSSYAPYVAFDGEQVMVDSNVSRLLILQSHHIDQLDLFSLKSEEPEVDMFAPLGSYEDVFVYDFKDKEFLNKVLDQTVSELEAALLSEESLVSVFNETYGELFGVTEVFTKESGTYTVNSDADLSQLTDEEYLDLFVSLLGVFDLIDGAESGFSLVKSSDRRSKRLMGFLKRLIGNTCDSSSSKWEGCSIISNRGGLDKVPYNLLKRLASSIRKFKKSRGRLLLVASEEESFAFTSEERKEILDIKLFSLSQLASFPKYQILNSLIELIYLEAIGPYSSGAKSFYFTKEDKGMTLKIGPEVAFSILKQLAAQKRGVEAGAVMADNQLNEWGGSESSYDGGFGSAFSLR